MVAERKKNAMLELAQKVVRRRGLNEQVAALKSTIDGLRAEGVEIDNEVTEASGGNELVVAAIEVIADGLPPMILSSGQSAVADVPASSASSGSFVLVADPLSRDFLPPRGNSFRSEHIRHVAKVVFPDAVFEDGDLTEASVFLAVIGAAISRVYDFPDREDGFHDIFPASWVKEGLSFLGVCQWFVADREKHLTEQSSVEFVEKLFNAVSLGEDYGSDENADALGILESLFGLSPHSDIVLLISGSVEKVSGFLRGVGGNSAAPASAAPARRRGGRRKKADIAAEEAAKAQTDASAVKENQAEIQSDGVQSEPTQEKPVEPHDAAAGGDEKVDPAPVIPSSASATVEPSAVAETVEPVVEKSGRLVDEAGESAGSSVDADKPSEEPAVQGENEGGGSVIDRLRSVGGRTPIGTSDLLGDDLP